MKFAVKYRIYPNKQQEVLINKTIGSARFIYNKILSAFYEDDKITTPAMYKQDFPFLKEVDSLALANNFNILTKSFRNYKKNKEHFGKPTYKKKSTSQWTYTTYNQKSTIKIENNRLILPKFRYGIKIIIHRKVKGEIRNVTIEHLKSGGYTATILYEVKEPKKHEKLSKENTVGLDLGLTTLITTSDGDKIKNPRFKFQLREKLGKAQRKLSRMFEENVKERIYNSKGKCIRIIFHRPLKDCKNYQKQKVKVAKINRKIKNQRLDYLHKVTSNIVKNHDYIVVETLKVSNMIRHKKLSKHIADAGWGKIIEMLEYKTEIAGNVLLKIGQWYPSSQICSVCGENDGKKGLSIREWECRSCGVRHERDYNAAKNIREEGLRQIA